MKQAVMRKMVNPASLGLRWWIFLLWIFLTTFSCALKPALVYLDEPLAPSPEIIHITSITAEEKGEIIRITVRAGQPFSYNISNHSSPLSLRIAISGAEFQQDLPREIAVGKGPVKAIHLLPASGNEKESRVVIGLDREAGYRIRKEGSVLFVDIKDSTRTTPVASSDPSPSPSAPSAKRSSSGDAGSPPLPDPQDYLIGGGDVLQIMVYDELDLNKTVRVSTGGVISFPLIGEVKVAGHTAAQVEWKLQNLLKEGYLRSPQVAVLVTEYHSKEIFILGAVERPGAFPLTKRSNLLEMLSRAGGIATKSETAGRELILLRPIAPKEGEGGEDIQEVQHIRIDLQKLLSGGDVSLNLLVQDKDTLYIPLADSLFVFGEVKNPGSHKILEKDITLLEAITMAGGFTPIAAPSRTKIVRMEKDVERTILVNVDDIVKRGDKSKDVRLKAGDLVVVPESFF